MKRYKIFVSLLAAVILVSGCSAKQNTAGSSEPAPSQSSVQNSEKESDGSSKKGSAQSSVPDESSSAGEGSGKEGSDTSSQDEPTDLSQLYDIESKYFVNKLSNYEKKAFLKLYTCSLAHEGIAEFEEPIPEEMLDKLMLLLNYDCPELIHLKGDYSPIFNEGKKQVSAVMFFYNMDKSEYEHGITEMKNYFQLIKNEFEGKTAYEKEKAVYDRIFEECVYNEHDKDAGSAYGAAIKRTARCEGISKAFMWCMRELGFECITLLGTPGWDVDAVYPNHSWNMIKIDNEWYHVDITSDNVQRDASETNPPLYAFLNANDELIYKTRELNRFYSDMEPPKSTSEGLYYHTLNNTLIRSGEDPQKRLNDILTERFRAGEINTIAIKLDSYDEYNRTLGMWEQWTDEFIEQNASGSYQTDFFYKRMSWSIAIRLIPE